MIDDSNDFRGVNWNKSKVRDNSCQCSCISAMTKVDSVAGRGVVKQSFSFHSLKDCRLWGGPYLQDS